MLQHLFSQKVSVLSAVSLSLSLSVLTAADAETKDARGKREDDSLSGSEEGRTNAATRGDYRSRRRQRLTQQVFAHSTTSSTTDAHRTRSKSYSRPILSLAPPTTMTKTAESSRHTCTVRVTHGDRSTLFVCGHACVWTCHYRASTSRTGTRRGVTSVVRRKERQRSVCVCLKTTD